MCPTVGTLAPLKTLSDRRRLALVLRKVGQLETGEICTMLETSPS